jgi:hypothetical protein
LVFRRLVPIVVFAHMLVVSIGEVHIGDGLGECVEDVLK